MLILLTIYGVLSAAFVQRARNLFAIVVLALSACHPAQATTLQVSIPAAATQHHRTLVRVAHSTMGLNAPLATLAAQVHQESRWQATARSPVGAMGLAQIMPATATWLAEINPQLGTAQPFNPAWSLSAMVHFDSYLLERTRSVSPCENWAFTLAAYNGGLGWVNRDKKLASALGADKRVYFNQVERNNAGRSAANFKENRHYVRVILTQWEPLYVRANWGKGVCQGVMI